MIALVWTFVRPFAMKALLILAAVATVLAVIARLKHAGRMQERMEQMAKSGAVSRKQVEAITKAPSGKKGVIDALENGTFAILLCLMLTGCAFDGQGASNCPPVVEYTKQFQKETAAALKTIPDDSPVHVMMSDYSRLRAAARACQ